MFLFRRNRRVFVILLIEILLLVLCNNGPLTKKDCMTAAAAVNSSILKPFLQIEKHAITRLIITKPRLPHFLSCIATIEERYFYYQNETLYYYTWYRNEEIIKHPVWRHNDFFVFPNGTLRLPPNERTSGIYRCQINANETAVISESITVEYPVLKRNTPNGQSAYNISAIIGRPFTLNCPMLSVPPANISWYFGNATLSKDFNDNRFLILNNGSLIFKQLLAKDTGKYKCLAQNQYALKNHRQFIWTLLVLPLDKDTDKPPLSPPGAQLLPYLQNATQYIPEGGAFSLTCHALSAQVSIEWWYQRNAKEQLIQLRNNSAVLELHDVRRQLHDGFYSCVTTRDKQIFRVIITTPPNITEQLPVYKGLITGSVVFHCRAEGNPKPTLSWYHNGAPLISSYTRYISGNDLYIHSFDPEEDGIYQCFARNVAGETYTAGEIRYNGKDDQQQQIVQVNPMQNIRCYAHSFNTINVTFDSRIMESLFMVHIVTSNPHRWITPFSPMPLNHTSYVIISTNLPIYRPFELITRNLFPTSEIRTGYKKIQQTMISSLRSPAVTCCTQGLLLHLVHLGNDTFVTWSQPEMNTKKYFIIQFSINSTQPHPQQMLDYPLTGTLEHFELEPDDVLRKLTNIEPLDQAAAQDVLRRAENSVADNEAVDAEQLEMADDIFSLVLPVNVTGVLMQNFTKMKIRVLLITAENENLRQDWRYVQWKIIENDTTEQSNTPFHLTILESRMLMFHFWDNFNETCVKICHMQIHFPYIKKEEQICETRRVENSLLAITRLNPNKLYRLHFSSCEMQLFYGQIDVKTLPDPPGTISKQRIIRDNGLKLSWEPPLQPNGRVHHYNILWTLGNVTHEANVFECDVCFYKFPNISESAKINVTVRVVGETGVGAPIFIDLRNFNHHTLEIERPNPNSDVYSGIVIGSLLSALCVICFALLIIFQRRRNKARQQGPTHLSTPTDINFGNLSNPGMPCDSAGGLSGSTLQQDCHEMQTLIPRSRYNIELLPDQSIVYQTTQLPNGSGNGNGNVARRQQPQLPHCERVEQDLQQSTLQDSYIGVHNLSQMPLCNSSPERHIAPDETSKAFFIAFKHTPPNAVAAQSSQKQSSSMNANSNGDGSGAVGIGSECAMPPNSLPLVSTVPFISASGSARRSGSLSSSSAGSSSNGSKKQYHTNFAKHSNSNDGICLLAEEESAATLTPTSEREIANAMLTNGFQIVAAGTSATAANEPTTSKANLNNNNAKRMNSAAALTTATTTTTAPPTTKTKTSRAKLKDRDQRQASTIAYSNNASIVPAIGPNMAVNASNAATAHVKLWPAPPSGNALRRANVDPNG